jgi:hypothetical protein
MASTDSPENPLDRWPLPRLALDADGDGHFTSADVFENLAALFFLPGDGCLFALSTYAAPIARLLGFSPPVYGGIVSGFLSACAWFVAFMVTSIAYHRVLDVDRRMTSATHRLFATAALRLRIGHALLRQRWRAWSAARRPTTQVAPVREVALSATELKVLQLHAGLAAGYALSVSEVADALGARNDPTRELLSGLKELGLLNRAIGGTDDETSYTLSSAGKTLLAARAARRRTPSPTHG